MAANYESVLLSEPITFLVGPQKKKLTMHKAVVTSLCKSLNQLLNGNMKEAKKRCVTWEDTDEQTCIRFGEWAYTGSYKAEEPELLLDSSQIATSVQDSSKVTKQEPIAKSPAALFQISNRQYAGPVQHCGRDWIGGTVTVACATCKVGFVPNQCQGCRCRRYTDCENCRKKGIVASRPTSQSMATQFSTNVEYVLPAVARRLVRANKESCEVYTQVFLSHAKLYVLADKYDIPDLRKLCLHHLHDSLANFTLYQNRVGDIVSLVNYSFENTIESDKLRSLLVEYCACFAKEMTKCKEFQELVSECPDFALGLIKELGRHLN